MRISILASLIVFSLFSMESHAKSFLSNGSTVVAGGGCCSDYIELILNGFSCADNCGVAFGGDDYILDEYVTASDERKLYFNDTAGRAVMLRDILTGEEGLVSEAPASWTVADTTQWIESEAFFFSAGDSVMVVHKLFSGSINDYYGTEDNSGEVLEVISVKKAVADVLEGSGENNPSPNSVTGTDGATIQNDDLSALLEVFPLPVKDNMNVVLPSKYQNTSNMVRIVDMSGKTLFTRPFQGTHTKLNVRELPEGTYLMRVTSADGSVAIESKILKR